MVPRQTLIRHPWSLHRVRTGITQQATAARLGVSQGFLVRVEQGLFSEAPRAIIDYYSAALNLDPEVLEAEYYSYIGSTRRKFSKIYPGFEILSPWLEAYNSRAVAGTLVHPLVEYYTLLNLSRIGFCKGLCVGQQQVLRYEQGSSMPIQLVNALRFINWDPMDLDGCTKKWRERDGIR